MKALRHLATAIILGLVLLTCSFPIPALAQGEGIIEGVIYLGTSNSPVPGVPLRLEYYEGSSLAETYTAESDDRGAFRFENLRVGANCAYLLRAEYGGITSTSEMILLSAEQPSATIQHRVYEAGAEDADIVIQRAHLIIQPASDAVQVQEVLIFSNRGDKAYVGTPAVEGGPPLTLRVDIPADAAALSFDEGQLGERFIVLEDGSVADTQPVLPGEGTARLVLAYNLPPQSGEWGLDYRFYYPVENLNVLLASEEWGIESDVLTFAGTMGGDMPFQNYAAKNMPADTTLTMTFKPGAGTAAAPHPPMKTAGAPQQSMQSTLRVIALVFGVLLLAGLVSYPAWRGSLGRGHEG